MDPLELFTIVILLAAIVPLALFVYFYGTRPAPGKWYRRRPSTVFLRTDIGKVLMSQKLALLTLLSFILAVRVTGDFPGREWVAFGLYLILVGLFWAVFIVLRRTQKQSEKDRDETE